MLYEYFSPFIRAQKSEDSRGRRVVSTRGARHANGKPFATKLAFRAAFPQKQNKRGAHISPRRFGVASLPQGFSHPRGLRHAKQAPVWVPFLRGGDEGARTLDLTDVNRAL